MDKKYKKPRIDKIKMYGALKQYCASAADMFYEENEKRGWLTKSGKPMKDWKSAFTKYVNEKGLREKRNEE